MKVGMCSGTIDPHPDGHNYIAILAQASAFSHPPEPVEKAQGREARFEPKQAGHVAKSWGHKVSVPTTGRREATREATCGLGIENLVRLFSALCLESLEGLFPQ